MGFSYCTFVDKIKNVELRNYAVLGFVQQLSFVSDGLKLLAFVFWVEIEPLFLRKINITCFFVTECEANFCDAGGSVEAERLRGSSDCECQCKKNSPTYREDSRTCVSDLQGKPAANLVNILRS